MAQLSVARAVSLPTSKDGPDSSVGTGACHHRLGDPADGRVAWCDVRAVGGYDGSRTGQFRS